MHDCIVLNLVNDVDVEKTQKRIEAYRLANKDSIARNQAKLVAEMAAMKKTSTNVSSYTDIDLNKLEDWTAEPEPADGVVENLVDAATRIVRRAPPEKKKELTVTREPWHTSPLDTVAFPPHHPSGGYLQELLSTVTYVPFAVDERMAAGGVTAQMLAVRALSAAFSALRLHK